MLRHLAPIIIPKTVGNPPTPNFAYKIAEELAFAIKDPNVKNVAISADYGAGKSSVVETAKEYIIKTEDIRWYRFKRKRTQSRFLTVSLAQLNANDRFAIKKEKPQTDSKKGGETDKDVEYSILQQLLYFDLPSRTPKSRFHRLGRIEFWKPLLGAIGVLLLVISYLVLFEPEKFKVPSFCAFFAVSSETKFWVDCVAAALLALLSVSFCVWLVRHAKFRIGKVKVKDAEVEVNTLSVFNQYLDEIIYFFASTRYNVVIFEDLDRFSDATRIFGKLRELNKILNSSKYLHRIIHREITFIYSVRDDLFDATTRVKFFDYIVPVIPVVNSSNAYDKLCEYLDGDDLQAFDGKDLLNLSDHFEELRLIINIVNEYDLYKKVIRLDDLKLSRKELFGLIVYKNYCPHDFICLQNKHGVLANILENKRAIMESAISTRANKKHLEEEKLRRLQEESSDWEKALRREYVEASKRQTVYQSSRFESYLLTSGTRVPFERLIEDPVLFEELVNDRISFYGTDGLSYAITPFANWQKAVNAKSYQERLKMNPHTIAINDQKERVDEIHLLDLSPADTFSTILKEEKDVLDDYLVKQPVEDKPYIPEECHKLLRFLLAHGFLDEHYLDYITYFYPNSLSIEDKRFVLNITSLDKDSLPCTYHLQNPVPVADRFELDDYKTNSRLLNVDLALSLARQGDSQKDNRSALQNLAKNNKAVGFVLSVYERRPSPEVDSFLSELLAIWDFGVLIQSLDKRDNADLSMLREINLRYSNLKDQEMINSGFRDWMNGHFGFLSAVFDNVGENRLCSFLDVYKPKFSKMNLASVSPSFATFIINGGYFSINSSNIENIASFLGFLDEYRKCSFTALYKCSNQTLIDLVKQRPQDFLRVFPESSVEESSWAKEVIAADSRISPAIRKDYLRKQSLKIQEASKLKDSALDFVFNNSLIEPTWENILYLCFEKNHAAPVAFLQTNTLTGFLSLKPEQRNAIVNQWVFSNILPFSIYEKVVRTMSGFRKLEPKVEQRRVDVLVSNGLLLFNLENYLEMRASYPTLAAKFIASNLKSYLVEISSYPVSSMEVEAVMMSIGPMARQAEYLSAHPLFEGLVSVGLADSICSLVQGRYLKVEDIEEGMLLQIIQSSSNIEIKQFVARKAIFELPYDRARCAQILKAMGGEYGRICEPGRYSWLSLNANNNRIAKYLKDNAFISGYERHEGRIKIIK